MSDKIQELFTGELKVIGVGLEHFSDTLRAQNVTVEHVAWRPPASGDKEILEILEKTGY